MIDNKNNFRRYIFAAGATLFFAGFWCFGCYVWKNSSTFLANGINVSAFYSPAVMFFRPLTLLFASWLLPTFMEQLCGAKPLAFPWVKHIRWLVLTMTTLCLLNLFPYLFNHWKSFFGITDSTFVTLPIIRNFEYEISVLTLEYPWVYALLGALLWLLGFPQKKDK